MEKVFRTRPYYFATGICTADDFCRYWFIGIPYHVVGYPLRKIKT